VIGTAYVQTGEVEPVAVLLSVPMGFLATAVLNVNNIRDLPTDAVAGKRTLAVRLGTRPARAYYAALVLGSFGMVLLAWGQGALGAGALTVALLLPLALRTIQKVWRAEGRALNPLLGETVRLQLLFAAALCVALWSA
jgi:1,4-dihydroxy-2-naphthoate octaprenyltransferase